MCRPSAGSVPAQARGSACAVRGLHQVQCECTAVNRLNDTALLRGRRTEQRDAISRVLRVDDKLVADSRNTTHGAGAHHLAALEEQLHRDADVWLEHDHAGDVVHLWTRDIGTLRN